MAGSLCAAGNSQDKTLRPGGPPTALPAPPAQYRLRLWQYPCQVPPQAVAVPLSVQSGCGSTPVSPVRLWQYPCQSSQAVAVPLSVQSGCGSTPVSPVRLWQYPCQRRAHLARAVLAHDLHQLHCWDHGQLLSNHLRQQQQQMLLGHTCATVAGTAAPPTPLVLGPKQQLAGPVICATTNKTTFPTPHSAGT